MDCPFYSPQLMQANTKASRNPKVKTQFVVTSSELATDHWPLATDHRFMDRIAALNDVLTQNPNDTFARYGLAMEYSKQGDLDRSLAEFSILLKSSPDY